MSQDELGKTVATRNIDWLSQYRQGGKLPSPKGVYLEALRLLEQEEVDNRELVRVLQSDPATNARLLQLANVSIRTRSRPIVAVSDAILVLGQAQIKRLILALALIQSTTPRVSGFDYAKFWTVSLLSALAVQALSEQLGQVNADEIFVVALLANVGELALVSLFSESYVELRGTVPPSEGNALLQMERQQYGIDHDELSSLLVEEWGLPMVFVEAIFHQAQPEELSSFPDAGRSLFLARLLRFGLGMAEFCLRDNPRRSASAAQMAEEMIKLGLDTVRVREQVSRLLLAWPQWQGLLQEAAPLLAEPLDWELLMDRERTPASDSSPLRVACLAMDNDVTDECMEVFSRLGLSPLMAEVSDTASLDLLVVAYQQNAREWITTNLRGLDPVLGPYILLVGDTLDAQSESELFRLGIDAYEPRSSFPENLRKHLQLAQRRLEARQKYLHRQERMRKLTGSLADVNRDLRQAALTDPLTHLRNRRYADERLAQEWSIAERHDKHLALMLLDLDNFKLINDTHGHDVGDEVLQRVSSILDAFARHQDIPCRVGGDEFLIICPDTDAQGVQVLARRICSQLAAADTWTDLQPDVSVSIGAASRDARMASAKDLLQAADHALFEAKRLGRNQAVLFARS